MLHRPVVEPRYLSTHQPDVYPDGKPLGTTNGRTHQTSDPGIAAHAVRSACSSDDARQQPTQAKKTQTPSQENQPLTGRAARTQRAATGPAPRTPASLHDSAWQCGPPTLRCCCGRFSVQIRSSWL